MLLFRLAGARRTRFLAQVVAAIVGAGFVVGIQATAILSGGTLSRSAMFSSPEWVAVAPGPNSPLWVLARAAMGDPYDLAVVLVVSLGLLFLAIVGTAETLARSVVVVAGLGRDAAAPPSPSDGARRTLPARAVSQGRVLRRKEWMLLKRDPWLVSQSLMQVLYLLPPGLMLWRSFGTDAGGLVVLVPVLVMAAGQLAGGLAWLAISGEDAPDLMASAPLSDAAILRAKTAVVMGAVALPLAPIALGLACLAPLIAGITLLAAGLATAGATAIQLIFRSRAKRSQFRRRQTSSRFATFAEASLSISVAAGAGLAAGGLWVLAAIPAVLAIGVLVGSRAVAGSQEGRF